MFKIEDNIAPPAPTRPRKRKCRTSTHAWYELEPGIDMCSKCGDVFPCDTPCEHVDCNDPEFYSVTPNVPE